MTIGALATRPTAGPGPVVPGPVGADPGWVGDPFAGTGFDEITPDTEMTPRLPPGARPVTAGIDLTDAVKMTSALGRHGSRLVGRLCGDAERRALVRYDDPLLGWGLALAFGIKEAVIKAAGGFPTGGRFTDVDSSELLLHALRSPCEVAGRIGVTGRTGDQLEGQHLVGGVRRFRDALLVCWAIGLADPPPPTRTPTTEVPR